ncbi:MAG: translation initiation factor IF-2 [Candidatus Omnitrophica bacterium]|nr:translation initiation factor IF-2 [Candidatus Omnitrophota bacterium]MCF7891986.1 translation initiation factor IF-2 [Candidatus Omnitrophota bacterium]MCF7895927.1 translation initiation factor IF-2 [Candidatus Omnitrophota bacterium]MCF7897489.1 translation initiation factor IF-2 [Candidatus Omnitrophota bacterium]MCF7909270.1 translation initiation factor IF-2 [Candidatus Omnitrophota bacterium]
MRIYELAKQLGVDSKELIKKLKALNFPVKNHMSVIDKDTAEIIKHEVEELDKKEIEENVIEVDFPITIKDLATKLGRKPSQLLSDLFKKGKMFTINQNLDKKTAQGIAYEYKVNLKAKPTQEEQILQAGSKNVKKRAPIVTLMGHIDHGKTSILDYIRKSKLTNQETGGITQHIGAYQLNLSKGKISFLDTPGHETFTQMRARGASITDIVIIVIAADDGIKPQTIEAIDHAKAADVPIIVAINKIDKANANVDMVKQGLSKHDLVPEDWGGRTTAVEVSATKGTGIDELLDLILLQAEVMELKADFDRPAIGVVVEGRLSKGKGALATVLVKEGTLNSGQWCVCGKYGGKIKAMHDDLGNVQNKIYPSEPIEILGLNGVPAPGDKLMVVPDEKTAKEIMKKRQEEEKKKKITPVTHLRLEDLHKKVKQGEIKKLKIILKADVGGTLEAVEGALAKIPSKEVELSIVHKGVGLINSSDILLAEVSDAIVVGFKVTTDSQARSSAKKKGIEVRTYHIIYELIDDIRAALEGLLTPHIKKTFMGRARVKAVFNVSKSGVIAGCQVEKGKILRGAPCHLIRGNSVVFEGKIETLKRFKNDAREVKEGYECGIDLGFDKIREGDYVDVFGQEVISRKL